MIRTGRVDGVGNRRNNLFVLQAYFANAKDPVSDDEFLDFWNSLSQMEKEYYLEANLALLFYAAKST